MARNWTDERLEERFDSIDKRFDRIDVEIRELRQDMKAGFARVDDRFDQMTERLEAMHRLMIQAGAIVIAALIGLIATQL